MKFAFTSLTAVLVTCLVAAGSKVAAQDQPPAPTAPAAPTQGYGMENATPPSDFAGNTNRFVSVEQVPQPQPFQQIKPGQPMPVSDAAMMRAAGQQAPKFYVYEFSASWCPSCRDLAPILQQVGKKYQGVAQLVPVDIDDPRARSLVQKAGLRAIPTVIICDQKGVQLQRLVGLQQGLKVDRLLEEYLQRVAAGAIIR